MLVGLAQPSPCALWKAIEPPSGELHAGESSGTVLLVTAAWPLPSGLIVLISAPPLSASPLLNKISEKNGIGEAHSVLTSRPSLVVKGTELMRSSAFVVNAIFPFCPGSVVLAWAEPAKPIAATDTARVMPSSARLRLGLIGLEPPAFASPFLSRRR